jgi:hypothetical protein
MEEENNKRGRGRPKGSKNKNKEPQPQMEVVDYSTVDFSKVSNFWRLEHSFLLPVQNLDYCSSTSEKNKSLLGFVEGFGDWDFGISFPYFFGPRIKNGMGDDKYWDRVPVLNERITNAFVSLYPNSKPRELVLFGQQEVRPNFYGPTKSVSFLFKEDHWSEEDRWMEP